MTIGPPVDMTSTASVELSQPAPRVWVLKMERKPDNRLSPEMLAYLMQRLDEIEVEWRTMNKGKENKDKVGGSVIIASSVTKFWSNGFIPTFLRRPGFKEDYVTPLLMRLMTYPLVTIAAIGGHCFAGGMLLALCCDYRLMGNGKGWMSMNELLIGLPVQQGSASIIRAKCRPELWRDIFLGKRYTSAEAKAAGFVEEEVDVSSGADALLKRAIEFGESEGPKAALGTWGSIKEGLYSWVGVLLRDNPPSRFPDEEETALFDRLERKKANL